VLVLAAKVKNPRRDMPRGLDISLDRLRLRPTLVNLPAVPDNARG
jgi:hypothetical protein